MKQGPLHVAALGVLAAGLAGLIGCASTPPAAAQGGAAAPHARAAATLPGTPSCFYLINFEGSWTVLSEDELIIYAPLYSNPYLIKLFEPIPNLKFDQRLGFYDVERTGMICDNADDDLVVPNWQPHRIPIVAVHQLTVAQADDLLRAHGIKVPPGGHNGKGGKGSAAPANSPSG